MPATRSTATALNTASSQSAANAPLRHPAKSRLLKRFDGTERRPHLGQLPILNKLADVLLLTAPLLDQASRHTVDRH